MLRHLILALLTVAALSFVAARTTVAAPISANNPYRSFNITGVNYGSMRWEQTHRSQSTARHAWTARRTGVFVRRR